MLTLQNICMSYSGTKVVDNINLEIEEGVFFAILGPSGSGKTTLLNIISGLAEQDSGSVVIDGRDMAKVPPNKRNIGMVFQNFFVYPHLNVFENISYPLKFKNKISKLEVQDRVKTVSTFLGIHHLLKRKSFELSGGEKQRVALARAIIKNPSLFLFDEPLSGLDFRLRCIIREELKKIHQKLRKTFVYVTHDQAEASFLADKIAIMEGGKILQLDSPQNIFDRPATLFVAEFMHTYYSKFYAVLTIKNGNPMVESELGEFVLEESMARHIQGDEAITLFVKSQDVGICQNLANEKDENIIRFETKISRVHTTAEIKLLFLENGLTMTLLKSNHRIGDNLDVFVKKSNILIYADNMLQRWEND